MSRNLQRVVKFVLGPYPKKYTAVLDDGRRVHFGDRRYQHYLDSVPKKMGGGRCGSKDHRDIKRRKSYRARHKMVVAKSGRKAYRIKYSPSWFSYYYLW